LGKSTPEKQEQPVFRPEKKVIFFFRRQLNDLATSVQMLSLASLAEARTYGIASNRPIMHQFDF
jgi:hypothetical protein